MKLVYYIDENCRNMRDALPALIEIHKARGIDDVKIAVTDSEFFRDTGFQVSNKDMYYDAKRPYANGNAPFLLRKRDLIEILPPTPESERFSKAFTQGIERFLCRRQMTAQMPPEIQHEIADSVQRLLPRFAPELAKSGDTAPDIHIDFDNQEQARYNAVITAACMRNVLFHQLFEKPMDYSKMLENLVDDEVVSHTRESFKQQLHGGGEVNYVIVTDDQGFTERMQSLFTRYGRTNRSFCLSPSQFKANCGQIVKQLRQDPEGVLDDMLPVQRESLAAALEASVLGLHTPRVEQSGTHGYQDMVVARRQMPRSAEFRPIS